MPKTWSRMPKEQFESLIKIVKETHDRMMQWEMAMVESGMPSLFTFWTKEHRKALGKVAGFSRDMLEEIDEQTSAFKDGDKCYRELEKERAAEAMKNRAEKDAPPKPKPAKKTK